MAAALHHSRDGGRVPYVGLRAQKTDSTAVEEEEVHEAYVVPREQKRPSPGERPAPLSEVAGPQSAVTVGYVAAGVPLLGVPSMASPSAKAIDESTLSFLLAGNLARVTRTSNSSLPLGLGPRPRCGRGKRGKGRRRGGKGRGGHVSAAALHDVSYDSLFSFLFGVWVLPETPGLLDFQDMTSMMFPYSTLSLVLGYTLMRQST